MTEHPETPTTLSGYTVESRSRAAFPYPSAASFPLGSNSKEGVIEYGAESGNSAPSFSITEWPMAEGVHGTYECADAMCDAVMGRIPPDFSGVNDPWIIALAAEITKNARTPRAEITAIWRYACAIPYKPHPIDIQIVSDARRTIERGWADCVSLTVLICTLAMARGFDCRFCLQYWSDVELYTHVTAEVFVDGHWLVCDAVAKDKPIDTLQPLPDGGFNLIWNIT